MTVVRSPIRFNLQRKPSGRTRSILIAFLILLEQFLALVERFAVILLLLFGVGRKQIGKHKCVLLGLTKKKHDFNGVQSCV